MKKNIVFTAFFASIFLFTGCENVAEVQRNNERETMVESDESKNAFSDREKLRQKAEEQRLESDAERARYADEVEQKRQLEVARRNTPQYKRDSAASEIRNVRAQIAEVKQSIADEQRVGDISGYVSASKLHDLGSALVFLENRQSVNWATYKRNGGGAETLNEVK